MLDKSEDRFPIKLMKKIFLPRQNAEKNTHNIDRISGTLGLIQLSRPSNLPAKTPEEELLHRKQHDEILEEVRKREQREERDRKRRREERNREEEKLLTDSRIWSNEVLPHFHELRDKKEIKELWWRGLPPSIRGRVWKLGIKNELMISDNYYENCLKNLYDEIQSEYLIAIKLDVSRTFPGLCVFQDNGPLNEALHSILAVYCVLMPDIGYVQGMSFIGAILTLNMEANDAFMCFSNLINNPCHKAAFTLNQKQMNNYYKAYTNALSMNLPKIYQHFTEAGLSPDFYLLDWLYTIYAKAMPLDVTCRIWDVFIRDGDEFLFRTALGVLHLYQRQLLEMDFVRGAQFLTRLPEDLQASQLFESIEVMQIRCGSTSFQEMIENFGES